MVLLGNFSVILELFRALSLAFIHAHPDRQAARVFRDVFRAIDNVLFSLLRIEGEFRRLRS